KPVMISEVGAVDRGGTTKADWITAFGQWVKQHPAIGGVTWFDTDTHPGDDENWRLDTDPEALAAYRAMARDPRFAGGGSLPRGDVDGAEGGGVTGAVQAHGGPIGADGELAGPGAAGGNHRPAFRLGPAGTGHTP